MLCTNCGKGELQELTGTALLICPLCSSKLINPQAQPPDPWPNLTPQERAQVMQFLEDAAKVKKQFGPSVEKEKLLSQEQIDYYENKLEKYWIAANQTEKLRKCLEEYNNLMDELYEKRPVSIIGGINLSKRIEAHIIKAKSLLNQ